jgi:hypothetical protein
MRFRIMVYAVVALATTATIAGPAAATDVARRALDGCDAGGGGQDIQSLESRYDRKLDQLTVTLRLCADAAPAATHRLHLDHTAPFVEQAAATARCATPADAVVTRGPNGHQGVGRSRVRGNRVVFTIPLAKLGVGSPKEVPQIPLWATSSLGDTVDRAPNRETGDGCQHPRALTETLVQSRIVFGKLIWVSKIPHEGFIDGINDADGACSMEAREAGITGTFVAWFSDQGISPSKVIFGNPGTYSTANGTVVAQTLTDLANCTKGASGADCLLAPLNRDIHGNPVPAGTLTWTGTLPDGTDSGAPNCNGWSSISASDSGNGGSVDELGPGWSIGSIGPCNQIRYLICLQVI